MTGLRLERHVVTELAAAEGVCSRPVMRQVLDRETNAERWVAISCGSTRESVCVACATRNRRLRATQAREGWHLAAEPTQEAAADEEPDLAGWPDAATLGADQETPARRVRSTKRRADVTDLPRVERSDRTVGAVFTSVDGREYRPSMFVTLTLPSYGAVTASGAPMDPASYRYRRQALDAMLFPRLLDQFWKNLRRCSGFNVQYFSCIEPQRRLAPHCHAAVRGAIPRRVLRRVVSATYVQIWWPPFTDPVYRDLVPVWDGEAYLDPATGALLPTWDEALDRLDADPDGKPAHVLRFGRQLDVQGIIAPSQEADRAIRYLVKYLTKSVAEVYPDSTGLDPAHATHVARFQAELRWLPCSEECANWLRYGVQPKNPGPGLRPGHCVKKYHDGDHLGLGGRRVLVSRLWSGKTLTEHAADRAAVVRAVLTEAGIAPAEIQQMSATVLATDGKSRYVWQDEPGLVPIGACTSAILRQVDQRRRWRADYERAKRIVGAGPGQPP